MKRENLLLALSLAWFAAYIAGFIYVIFFE
jgi:hypothetical protein